VTPLGGAALAATILAEAAFLLAAVCGHLSWATPIMIVLGWLATIVGLAIISQEFE